MSTADTFEIIHALREVDAGAKVQDIVRRLGVSG